MRDLKAPSDRGPKKRREGMGAALQCAILVACAILAFGNSLQNGFAYDDTIHIVNNSAIRSFSSLVHSLDLNRPIRGFTFVLDYRLWRMNPFGYHFTNLILHVVCVVLVFSVVRRMFNDQISAFIVALLFSVYPVATETIDNISNRNDLLATVFCLLALHVYTGKGGLVRFLLLVFPLHLLAALSKEAVAASLPLIFIAHDWYFVKGKSPRLLFGRISYGYPLLLVSLAIIAYALTALDLKAEIKDTALLFAANTYLDANPVTVHCCVWIRAIAKYVLLVVYPHGLSADYAFPRVASIVNAQAMASVAVLLGFMSVLVLNFKRLRAASFGLLWFLIFLLPASNIVPIAPHFVAERYLYAPLIGYCIFLSAAFGALARMSVGGLRRSVSRRLAVALVVVVMTVFIVADVRRNGDWQSDWTIWQKTRRQQPTSLLAQYNAGAFLFLSHDFVGAKECYEKALSICENYNTKLGAESKKRYEASEVILRTYVAAHNGLGLVYEGLGRYEDALRELEIAIGLDKKSYYPYFNIGLVYMNLGNVDNAIRYLEQALRLAGNLPAVRRALEEAYRRRGDLSPKN